MGAAFILLMVMADCSSSAPIVTENRILKCAAKAVCSRRKPSAYSISYGTLSRFDGWPFLRIFDLSSLPAYQAH